MHDQTIKRAANTAPANGPRSLRPRIRDPLPSRSPLSRSASLIRSSSSAAAAAVRPFASSTTAKPGAASAAAAPPPRITEALVAAAAEQHIGDAPQNGQFAVVASTAAAAAMHSFDMAAGVPAFLAKLWRLVEDPDTNHLIYWQQDGHSFIIQNQAQFARELLPLNYKHNNMASFIRQLNMYGFHKITSIDNGGLKFDKDEMEFSHSCFRRDSPFLLEHIKRKIANPKPSAQNAQAAAIAAAAAEAETRAAANIRPETVTKVMNDVKAMRSRQESLDSRFSSMKQENEALWREVAILRQKHSKQQQIVNKLIQFLVTLVQPTRPGSGINNMNGVKRRFQLMINDVPETGKAQQTLAASATSAGASSGPGGRNSDDLRMPAISELTDELMDDYEYGYDDTASPNVMSPASAGTSIMAEEVGGTTPTQQIGNSVYADQQMITSIVDHPDTDTDDEHLAKPIVQDGQFYFAENNNGRPISASPQADWLEQQMLISPQMIKKENDCTATGYEYYVPDESANIAGELSNNVAHTMAANQEPTVVSTVEEQPMAPKRVRQTMVVAKPKHSAPKANARGLQLQIGQNRKMPVAMQSQQRRGGNPMISGRSMPAMNVTNIMPSSSRGTKRAAPVVVQSNVLQQTNVTPANVYANRSDFVGAEMPADLFDTSSSALHINTAEPSTNGTFTMVSEMPTANASTSTGVSSLLLGDSSSANFDPTLSENLAKRVISANNPVSGDAQTMSSDNNGMALAKYGAKENGVVEEVNMQLDSIQGELESMKDLFKGDEYTLDTSALMGNAKNRLLLSPTVDSELFSKIFSDIDSPYGLSLTPDLPIENRRYDDPSGSELMMYQPNHQLDLNQLLCDANANDLQDEENDQHEEPDYYAQELHTPLVEKKSISFRPNRYNSNT